MHATDILTAAIAVAWIVFAGALVALRVRAERIAHWVDLLVLFCLLRALDLLLTAFGVEPTLFIVIAQTVALGLLLVIIFGSDRVRRIVESARRDAEEAQAEYARALLDYTQLMRHRVANPLTAVKAGIQTLQDLELDRAMQKQLLASMLEQAERLQQIALHPEQIGDEEADLTPTPAPLSGEDKDQLEREAAHIEGDFRALNAEMLRHAPDHVETLGFLCECSARECASQVDLALADYLEVHADGTQFVIAPGHDLPAVEDVVARNAGWWVVRKRGEVARKIDIERQDGTGTGAP